MVGQPSTAGSCTGWRPEAAGTKPEGLWALMRPGQGLRDCTVSMPRTAAMGSVFSVRPSSLRNTHQPSAATTTAASMTSGPPSCSDRSTAKRVIIERYRFGRSLRTEELTVEPPGSLPTGSQECRRRMEVPSCSSDRAHSRFPGAVCRQRWTVRLGEVEPVFRTDGEGGTGHYGSDCP